MSIHTLFSKQVEDRIKNIWKIYMTVLILKNCKRNHLISCSLNEWTWKNITESQDRWNFERLHTLFVIYTCDTTLHSCYKRMHLFSANQKLVIFSCTLSNNVIIWCKCFRWLHEVTLRYILPKRVKGRLKITPRYTLPKRVLDRLKITPRYTLPKKV